MRKYYLFYSITIYFVISHLRRLFYYIMIYIPMRFFNIEIHLVKSGRKEWQKICQGTIIRGKNSPAGGAIWWGISPGREAPQLHDAPEAQSMSDRRGTGPTLLHPCGLMPACSCPPRETTEQRWTSWVTRLTAPAPLTTPIPAGPLLLYRTESGWSRYRRVTGTLLFQPTLHWLHSHFINKMGGMAYWL